VILMQTTIVIISKNEERLIDTLDALAVHEPGLIDQIVVIDASAGRLDHVRRAHPHVEWEDYTPPSGVRVSIPQQRNRGVRLARGEVVVFIDCGCLPQPGWLRLLLGPIADGSEQITCGPATARGSNVYGGSVWSQHADTYVDRAPTINLAFRREVFDEVGGFDESFEYGSDIDFTWRVTEHGHRIRFVAEAVVEHEWGDVRRQVRRAFAYGVANARLYRKHPRRIRAALADNPVPFAYPLFLLGLPLTMRFRAYPLLVLVPLWRNRRGDSPLLVLADHLVHGAGVLAEVSGVRR
jgi:glycosyltransferase involved in cell wall biosynthesis